MQVALQNMNASYLFLTHSNDGRTSQQAGLNGSAFDNQLSYGIYQNTDNKADSYSGNMNMSYSGSKGTLSGVIAMGKIEIALMVALLVVLFCTQKE